MQNQCKQRYYMARDSLWNRILDSIHPNLWPTWPNLAPRSGPSCERDSNADIFSKERRLPSTPSLASFWAVSGFLTFWPWPFDLLTLTFWPQGPSGPWEPEGPFRNFRTSRIIWTLRTSRTLKTLRTQRNLKTLGTLRAKPDLPRSLW